MRPVILSKIVNAAIARIVPQNQVASRSLSHLRCLYRVVCHSGAFIMWASTNWVTTMAVRHKTKLNNAASKLSKMLTTG